MVMIVVFCRDPLEPSRPDQAFGAEASVAEQMSLPYVLVDFDALVREDDPARAVRRVLDQPNPVLAAYRGWMVTPTQYRKLFEALSTKNVRLINDPEQYRHGHHLPENYSMIRDHSPRSVWLTGDLGPDRIMDALVPFGNSPVIVKDFVKSRKHEWAGACFIPSASDREAVGRVVGRFLELQGDNLAEGLVFREFVEFEPVGVHPRSGMPLAEEYRSSWLRRLPRLPVALLGRRELRHRRATLGSVLRCRRRRRQPLLHDGPGQAARRRLDDRRARGRPGVGAAEGV